jgi:hypothetical protein
MAVCVAVDVVGLNQHDIVQGYAETTADNVSRYWLLAFANRRATMPP